MEFTKNELSFNFFFILYFFCIKIHVARKTESLISRVRCSFGFYVCGNITYLISVVEAIKLINMKLLGIILSCKCNSNEFFLHACNLELGFKFR